MAAAKMLAKEEGYAQGVADGVKQAGIERAQREKDTLAAATRIGEAVERLVAGYGNFIVQQSAELSELIFTIAKKVAGDALDQRGMDTVVALVRNCMPVFYDKPRIVIETHPTMLDNIKDALKPILQQHGFEGDVIYRGNDAIGKHDARVDWGHGESIRSTDAIWQEIERLMHQHPVTPTLAHTHVRT
jgi:flagellar assembly protein FliH